MLQYVSAAISVLCLNKNDFHRQTQLLYLFLFILLAPLGGSAIYHPRGKKIRQRDFNLFVQDRENPVISHVIAANSCVLPQGEQAASQTAHSHANHSTAPILSPLCAIPVWDPVAPDAV